MNNNFIPIQQIMPLGNTAGMFTQQSSPVPVSQGEGSFASFFNQELSKINDGINAPGEMAGDLATGNLDNLHKISIENAKADTLLKLATKVMSSLAMDFKTLMQMQI